MKGISPIISSTLLIIIYITLTVMVLFWGLPIIQQNQDYYLSDKSEDFLFLLDRKIERIAKLGGSEDFFFDLPGRIYMDAKNDTIEFQVKTSEHKYGSISVICLSETCNSSLDNSEEDSFFVLKAEVYKFEDKIIVVYTMEPRNIKVANETYTVDLITPENKTLIGDEKSKFIIKNSGEIRDSGTIKTKIYINFE